MIEHKIPPFNLGAERTILASMLSNTDALYQGIELLKPLDFYSSAHRIVFEAIIELVNISIPVDVVTLTNTLKVKNKLEAVGEEVFISELIESTDISTVTNLKHHAKIIKDLHVARELIKASNEIQNSCFGFEDIKKVIRIAENKINNAVNIIANSKVIKAIKELINPTLELIEMAYKTDGITGITSGIKSLDAKTGGFQNTDLITIAGQTSMGKTGLMLDCVLNAAQIQKIPSLIFSLEMSKTQLTQRLMAIQSGVNLHYIRSGTLSLEEYQRITVAAGELQNLPIYIDDTSGVIPSEIMSKVRRYVIEKGIKIIWIDYLQLMDPGAKAQTREREVAIITKSLKAIAKDFDIPVIELCQLSRALASRSKKQKRPILSDLRESGAIEQDSDVVIFIYRAEKHDPTEDNKGKAELIISKQRNGPVGTVKVNFEKTLAHFSEPEVVETYSKPETEKVDDWHDKF